MTAPNYAAMTDAELNKLAGCLMWGIPEIGYLEKTGAQIYYWGGARCVTESTFYPYSFKPSADLNHAAEFSAWFRECEREKGHWYNLTIESVIQQNAAGVQVERFRCKLWRGQVIDRDSGIFYALCDSRARAETEATLKACYGVGA